MHLFAKQINRRTTLTNISHCAASVNKPIPEEKAEKVCLYLLPLPALSIPLKHAIPKRKYNLVQAAPSPVSHPSLPHTDSRQHRGSHPWLTWATPWSDGSNTSSVYTLDSGTASLRDSFLHPAPNQFNSMCIFKLTNLTTLWQHRGKAIFFYRWRCEFWLKF